MTPELARQLIKRVPIPGTTPEPGRGNIKQREIRFRKMPPDQVANAFELLDGLENLTVARGPHALGLTVTYDLLDYTLEGIEKALRNLGYHLDNSLYIKIVRALVFFTEETQLRNLNEPARLIKQSNEVFIKAYDQHPHGDSDDTPDEARENW